MELRIAAIDYTLAPQASVGFIVEQCRRAIASLHRQASALGFDARRIYVSGNSAGAHLAAMLLVAGWQAAYGLADDVVAGAVLLSGIYDLEPLMGTYIDAALHLTPRRCGRVESDAVETGPTGEDNRCVGRQ